MALTPDQEKMREAAKALHRLSTLPQSRAYSDALIAFAKVTPPAAILALLDQVEALQADARRFALAIALEDNAEGLYAAVMSNAGNGVLIRAQFDADMALSPLPPPPEAA